ncbi:LOB domain-containing protein [Actinidia chinensis var. chinensis]|uniref:LOB domain-containing protein n=1 Tax=Actinidia chinensis var. chinensis TaxID=1590841 RepID=A0A2R6RYF4_ACTCC|nr:LOB domain-containing protein [Actinidia chinensis var. chinensis]
MRMSCNGCRVLRKGCSDGCSIRPCLQWIKSPDSQANATVFLAKFYGRAGLINLINAGPDNLRPAIFRSLLYEACGRIVNPIYGSVGLLWSGNWLLCQNAVEAVLNGAPIIQIGSEAAECDNGPPLKAYDIRHVSKEDNPAGPKDLHRVRTRCRFKRSAVKPKASQVWSDPVGDSGHDELNRSTSHESSLSHQSEMVAAAAEKLNVEGESRELESVPKPNEAADNGEIELELTLGLEPSSRSHNASPKRKSTGRVGDSFDDGACRIELGLP